jgi:regulator of protease activity HflC (stomatin/prohibitin superfamily)
MPPRTNCPRGRYGVCRDALNPQKSGWNQDPRFSTYVAEAARRGLTVDACVHLITQAASPATAQAENNLDCAIANSPPPPCTGCSPYVAEKIRQKDLKRIQEARQRCAQWKREEAERKEAARRQQAIEEAKRKEEAERWRKAEQERQAAAAAAAAEAAKPINRLRRAYFNYLVVKECYDVRLGYQLVYINEVEMERARVTVKAIETSILKQDSSIDTNNTWQQAAQLIEASKQYVERYFCQKTYHDLLSAAPYSAS